MRSMSRGRVRWTGGSGSQDNNVTGPAALALAPDP